MLRLSKEQIATRLGEVSDARFHELCIAALRAWYARSPRDRTQFWIGEDLVMGFLHQLHAPESVSSADSAVANSDLRAPWLAQFVTFAAWLVRVGLAWPLGAAPDCPARKFLVTPLGHDFLALANEDHPLMPGFAIRLAGRCPGLPVEVVSLFADATACIDRGLCRPAIAIMGVAYEMAVEHVLSSRVATSGLAPTVLDASAARRVDAVRGEATHLPNKSPTEKERRSAILSACEFADHLRRRRNDAAHTKPAYGFEDRDEAEELLVSSGRHLPHLWSLR